MRDELFSMSYRACLCGRKEKKEERERKSDETRRILASELRWTMSIVIVEAITALDVIVYVLHVRLLFYSSK